MIRHLIDLFANATLAEHLHAAVIAASVMGLIWLARDIARRLARPCIFTRNRNWDY